MNNAGCGKSCAGIRRRDSRPLREKRQHDELQSDQRARRRPNDYVEVLPSIQWCHVICSKAASQIRAIKLRAAEQRSELSPGRGFSSPGLTSEVVTSCGAATEFLLTEYNLALLHRSRNDFAIRNPIDNIIGRDSVRRAAAPGTSCAR